MRKLLDMDDVEIVAERLKRMMMEDSNPTSFIFNDVVTLLSLIDELKKKAQMVGTCDSGNVVLYPLYFLESRAVDKKVWLCLFKCVNSKIGT